MINTTLKVPTLGVTDINYLISGGRILFQVKVSGYTTTGLTFSVTINVKNYLTLLQMTYMALDNTFTPAFSMNQFFPVQSPLSRASHNLAAAYMLNFMLTLHHLQVSH